MPPPKILIIDDDQFVVDILREVLKNEGFDVIAAPDGLAGIEMVLREEPNLVILDVMMPGCDGYEVCKKLKESPKTASTPVIFLSARFGKADIARGLKTGADEYMTKPFEIRPFVKRVRELLGEKPAA